MSKLLELIFGAWDWIGWAWRTTWGAVVRVLMSVWGMWVVVLSWIIIVVEFAKTVFTEVGSLFSSLVTDAFDLTIPSELSNLFAVVNYLTPLKEFVVLVVAYGGVLVIMAVYKHLKSLVPSEFSGGT